MGGKSLEISFSFYPIIFMQKERTATIISKMVTNVRQEFELHTLE
jgi:hypothetical protein